MSFIRFGGWGNALLFKMLFKCLKALGLLPKKPFSKNIKGPQPTARFRQKFYHDSLLSYTHGTKCFFCLQLHYRLYVFFRVPID